MLAAGRRRNEHQPLTIFWEVQKGIGRWRRIVTRFNKAMFSEHSTEVETITALLRNYEGDMTWILIQLLTEEDVNRPDPSVTLPLNLRKPLTHSLSASCNKIVKAAVLLMTCAMLLKDYKVKSLILQIGCSKFHLTRKILVSVKKGTSAFRLVK